METARYFAPCRRRFAARFAAACRRGAWLAAVLGLGCLGTVRSAGAEAPTDGFVFAIEAAADRDLVFELYFDGGTGWSADAVVRQNLTGDDRFHRLEFALPALALRQLRLDPGYGGAKVRLRQPSLTAPRRAQPVIWSAEVLKPGTQIATFAVTDGVAVLTHAPGANDPMLFVEAPIHAIATAAVPATGWPRGVAPVLAAIVSGLIGWILFTALRAIGPGSASPRFARYAALGVFLLVFGLRLAWVDRFGTPVPYYDEWDSEGRAALLAWHDGRLDWKTLSTPHNEHRLVLSRLLAIGGTALTGEWDPRCGMVLGCALIAALATLGAAAAVNALGRVGLIPALAIAVFLAAPTDSTNLVWGGQVQMYLFLTLTVAVLALAGFPSTARASRIALWIAALLLLGTMGSALIAAGVAAGLVLCARGHDSRDASPRETFVTFAGLVLVVFVGWFWRAEAPHHVALRAKSFVEWSEVFLRVRAWPASGPLGGFGWWLPFFVLLVLTLRLKLKASPLGWFALGSALWTLVQCAALAFARAGGDAPEPRHFTLLLLTPLSAAFALLALAAFAKSRERVPWMRGLMLTATLALAISAVALARPGVAALRETHAERLEQQRMLVEYFTTGDAAKLDPAGRAVPPYISGPSLATLLRDPAWRELLPRALQEVSPPAGAMRSRAWPLFARSGIALGVIGAVLCLLAWFRRHDTVTDALTTANPAPATPASSR